MGFFDEQSTRSKEKHSGFLRVFDKKDFRWVFVRFPVVCDLICMTLLVLKELVHLWVSIFFKLEVKTKTRKEGVSNQTSSKMLLLVK